MLFMAILGAGGLILAAWMREELGGRPRRGRVGMIGCGILLAYMAGLEEPRTCFMPQSLRPFMSGWGVWIMTDEADVMAGLIGVLGLKAGGTAAALDATADTGTVAGVACGRMWGRATRGVAVAGVVVVSAGRALALPGTGNGTGTGPQLRMVVCVTDVLGTVWVGSEALTGAALVVTQGFSAADVTGIGGGKTTSFSPDLSSLHPLLAATPPFTTS